MTKETHNQFQTEKTKKATLKATHVELPQTKQSSTQNKHEQQRDRISPPRTFIEDKPLTLTSTI